MLIREIAKPIDRKYLSTLLQLLQEFLPATFQLDSGESISKNDIKLLDRRGIYGLWWNDKAIFSQESTSQHYRLISNLQESAFHQLIESLPEKDKQYLECLNLLPSYATLLHQETLLLEQHPAQPLQIKKSLTDVSDPDADLTALRCNPGVAYLQNYFHAESWTFIFERLSEFAKIGVKIIYLDLPTLLAPLFRDCHLTGDIKSFEDQLHFYRAIKPEQLSYLHQLCFAAQLYGIPIIPIGSSAALLEAGQKDTESLTQNNFHQRLMQTHLTKHQADTEGENKFVVVLDLYHSNVARALNIPSIGLHPDDKTNSLNPEAISSAKLRQIRQEFAEQADFNFTLPSKYQPTPQKKPSCTPQLMRLGLFAVVGLAVSGLAYVTHRVMNGPGV